MGKITREIDILVKEFASSFACLLVESYF